MSPEPGLAMLQRPSPVRRSIPALLAALAAATPLSAQRTLVGIDVNSASEAETERAPQLFASAGLGPRGRWGVSVHGMATRVESDVRLDLDGTSGRATASGYRTTGSAFYGVTPRLTLGAFLSGVQGVRWHLDQVVDPTPDPHGGPSRQGTRTPIGSNELGVYARFGVWSSPTTGATRLALNAIIDDAVDQGPGTTAGFAAQHRMGRMTLHVAPSLRFSDGVSGAGADSWNAAGRLGAAASIAAGRQLGLSIELLREGFDFGTTDAAIGARWRLGRFAVDAGVRSLIESDYTLGDASRYSAMLATRVVF